MGILYLMFGISVCMVAIGILISYAHAKRKINQKAGPICLVGGAVSALIILLFL